MATSKAQQRAVNKYMAANYDRINLTLPKGKKDVIRTHADSRGESVNAFINRAIDRLLEEEEVLAGGKDEQKEEVEGDNSNIPVSGLN